MCGSRPSHIVELLLSGCQWKTCLNIFEHPDHLYNVFKSVESVGNALPGLKPPRV